MQDQTEKLNVYKQHIALIEAFLDELPVSARKDIEFKQGHSIDVIDVHFKDVTDARVVEMVTDFLYELTTDDQMYCSFAEIKYRANNGVFVVSAYYTFEG